MILDAKFTESNHEMNSAMGISFGGGGSAIDDGNVSSATAWSSKNTVDKLCPSFAESGSAIRCEPVEGYPLNVVTKIPETEAVNSITLTQCGKNLFDCTKYEFGYGYITKTNGYIQSGGSTYSYTDDFIPIAHLRGKTITLNHPGCEANTGGNGGLVFYRYADQEKEDAYISGTNEYTHVVPDDASYMRFTVPRAYMDGTQIQIEIGDSVTEFEPYREPVQYTAEFPEPIHGSYEWNNIKAVSGSNSIWSSIGTTEVEGKADPVAIIEKLTKAIISLGGNV